MKGKLFKKLLAVATSVLMLSGGVSVQPFADIFKDTAITASAESGEQAVYDLVTEVPTVDGGQSTNWNTEYDYYSLVDGNTSTVYGISNANPWVEFHYSRAFVPKKYILWTGDTWSFAYNPATWTIKAKLNKTDAWTTLATVDNSSGDQLPEADGTSKEFSIEDNTNAYKYFRFEATRKNNGTFQLGELQFKEATAKTEVTWKMHDGGGVTRIESGKSADFTNSEGNVMRYTWTGNPLRNVWREGACLFEKPIRDGLSVSFPYLTGKVTKVEINQVYFENAGMNLSIGNGTANGKLKTGNNNSEYYASTNDDGNLKNITFTGEIDVDATNYLRFTFSRNGISDDDSQMFCFIGTSAAVKVTLEKEQKADLGHTFTTSSVTTSGSTLTATCTSTDADHVALYGANHHFTLTLNAADGMANPGVPVTAWLTPAIGDFNEDTQLGATCTVEYAPQGSSSWTTSAPYVAGNYTARATIRINSVDYVLTKNFSVIEGHYITNDYPQFSVNKAGAMAGENITVTFTPQMGESVEALTVTGDNTSLSLGKGITDNGDNTYTFTMPNENVTIGATFSFPANSNFTQDGNTYTIKNADGWNYFCQLMQYDVSLDGFNGKTVELADNITVSTMAGTTHPFKGTFDGKGKTLTFNRTADTIYTAPFQNTNGATICNLHVTGLIEGGSYNYLGGLVGSSEGNLNIENCHVSTQISTTFDSNTLSANVGIGGIVGYIHYTNYLDKCHITGCVFDGLIYNSNTWNQTYGCGGFVGCLSEYAYVDLTDCLFIEGQYDNNGGKCELLWGHDNNKNSTFFHRSNNQGEGKLTNCFYVETRGLKQGSPASTSVTKPANLGAEIDHCFMKSYGHVLFFNGKYYTPTSGDLIEQYSDRGIKSYTIECNDGTSLGIPNITTPLWTSDLRYNRAFTAGKPEIVMLPFNFTKNDFRLGGSVDPLTGKFYSFAGMDSSVPVMDDANEVTSMIANTPYIYVPGENSEYWYIEKYGSGITIFTEGNEGGNKTVTDKYGLWTLKGTYEPIIFTASDTDVMILDNDGSPVEVTDDAKVNPTSGYFVRDNSAYSVTVNSANGGTVTADKNLAKENDTITLTVTPDAGYAVESVKYNDTNATKNADGTYSFTMPSENVTVSAEFARVFTGESISLGGDIGVIFYLNPAVVKVGNTVSFSYTVNTNGTDNTTTKTYTLQSTDLKTVTYKGTEYQYYAAPCYVNAAEMTSLVTATVTVNETQYTSQTSVKEYANTILNDNEYSSAHDLVKAMLDYGAKAQTKFGRNTDNLANEGLKNADGTDYVTDSNITSANITSQRSDMENGLSNYGISYEGTSLLYLDKTTIRHYYSITNNADTQTVIDNIVSANDGWTGGTKDNYIYFEKPNIGADDLATAYALKIGENNYSFSALDYSKGVLEIYEANKGFTENDADLARATYAYATAAAAYNKQNGGA